MIARCQAYPVIHGTALQVGERHAFVDSARVVSGWWELRNTFRFFRTDRVSSTEICGRYPARRADLIGDVMLS